MNVAELLQTKGLWKSTMRKKQLKTAPLENVRVAQGYLADITLSNIALDASSQSMQRIKKS